MLLLICFFFQPAAQESIGIGTTTPHASALLHINAGLNGAKGLLVTGFDVYPSVTVPDLGSGNRLMFYPGKAAFRAGSVDGNEWNNNNVGHVSTAFGGSTIASGNVSTAFGYNTIAGGSYSTAMGSSSQAMGIASLAAGSGCNATGNYSIAIGSSGHATGNYSIAMGRHVSTNNQTGAFFFGDSDPNNKGIRPIGFPNQIAMRFNGGYYFISDDAGNDIGVRVLAGGNSWTAISDVNRKENFLPVDGEAVLNKIGGFTSASWNYKGQDPKTFRHYGPMAQEFFNAFGKDELGSIGCDTLINQQDFLGVNLIAIQALAKRTTLLQKENDALRERNQNLETRLEKLEKLLTSKK